MSELESKSAPPEAAAPGHPEHARWVKERTLAMELAHQQRIGGSLRDAENANARALERLAARTREDGLPVEKPHGELEPRTDHAGRWAERAAQGVTRKAAPILTAPSSRCGMCGACTRCKREARIHAIHVKAREGDRVAVQLSWELAGAMLACHGQRDFRAGDGAVYPFSRMMMQGERNIAFLTIASSVCDRSVKLLGPWR